MSFVYIICLYYYFQTKNPDIRKERKKGNFIPPMSMSKFLRMNKNQRQAAVGSETYKSLSSALEIVQRGQSSLLRIIYLFIALI